MNTFLPYEDFVRSAKVLDYKRLGKQRLEASILINGGWPNHPAAKMWKEYKNALKEYYNCILQEWINRGYNNSMKFFYISEKIVYPWWLGEERLHSLYRATLLYKNFEYYSQFGWKEEPKYGYWWPV